MSRFELSTDESLIFKQEPTSSVGSKYFGANVGTLYLTNKRVVFCSTSRWKTLVIFSFIATFFSSKNIRLEGDIKRFNVERLKFRLGTNNFLTLDGENTFIVVGDEFQDKLSKSNQS